MRLNSRKMILVLSICMALQTTSFVIIVPLFARRFNALGAGVEALGLSEMAYALTSTLAAPWMGALADRLGRRPLVLVSLAAYAAAFCGYLLASSAEAIILIRGLAGAFTAGLVPAVTALAADAAPEGRQARFMGFINGGAAFGWIAGPVAGGMIYDRWGYSAALLVSIGIAVLTLLFALLGIPSRRTRPERPFASGESKAAISHIPGNTRPGKRGAKDSLSNLRQTLPQSLQAFIILLLIFFAVMFAWAFVGPRLMFYAYNDLGWSSSMLGLVMSTYGIAMMVGELSLGGLSDRWGRKPVILLGLALYSAQFIGMAFFQNHLLVSTTFVIGGLGNSLFDPAINASILDISPIEHRSRIMGIKGMAGSMGMILGPALVASLGSSIPARSIFLAAVGIVVLTVLAGLSYPSTRRRKQQHFGTQPEAELEATSQPRNVEKNTDPSLKGA